MSALRLLAIGLIFVFVCVAWVVLGGATTVRTETADANLRNAVGGLYGQPQSQQAPVFTMGGKSGKRIEISGSDITASFDLDQRRKGLMWYSTYHVDFAADYRVVNPSRAATEAEMLFTFPDPSGVYDGFAVTIDGVEVPVTYDQGAARVRFELAAGKTATVHTGYVTGGLDRWEYVPAAGGASVVRDFSLTMRTDFANVDFPEGSVSPKSRKPAGDGLELRWDYDSVVSGRPIALTMPQRIQPGPLASRVSFFAPVALLFFFAALVLLTATKDVRLHPMHYGFIAAGFFAFHLLFAYLVDRIDLNVAFAICSVVSVGLCVGYLRAVLGANRALIEIAISQVVFLVLFSYSFFFEGLTGLAVAIGSVLTLAYFMAKTARVDWEAAFAKPAPIRPDASPAQSFPEWEAPA
ncbi:MAG: hypothetical protein FDZ70_07710 [Actinobacteria bacterium]|nr:MAG: hypothetical protein FDZ70_07710 [Actinomycetota bacterium]